MSAPHTPGPWRWEIGGDGWDGETCSLMAADGSMVLMGWGYDASGITFGQGDRVDVKDQPNLPDARLIAAAPDLLAALKHYVSEHTRESYDMAVDAIAKAEGR